MIIELTDKEFGIHDNIGELNDVDVDNSYDVLNYNKVTVIGTVK